MISVHFLNNARRSSLLSPFYERENRVSERPYDFPKVTQLGPGRNSPGLSDSRVCSIFTEPAASVKRPYAGPVG